MSPARKALVLAAVMMGGSLAASSFTIISLAAPPVAASLGGPANYGWTLFAYLLSSTISLPLCGRLGDIFGRKRVYFAGSAIFLLGSALCGISLTMGQLILFRTVQGFGAGALITIAMTVVADVFSAGQRAKIQGLFGSVLGMASILGPGIGLAIAEGYGWRWIFFAGLIPGAASAALLGFGLNERTGRTRHAKVDYPGGVTFAVGIAVLLLTILDAATRGAWLSLNTAGMLAISATILGVFVMIESSVKEPMLPLSFLLSNRTIRSCSVTGLFTGTAMLGAISYVPLFAQGVIGSARTTAGDALLPLGLGWLVGSAVAGYVVLRMGYRCIVLFGATMIFLGAVMLTLLDASSTTVLTGAAMGVIGLGLGFSTTSLLVAVQNSVISEQQGLATSSVQFFRMLGGIIGLSVLEFLLNSQMARSVTVALESTYADRTFSSTYSGFILGPTLAPDLHASLFLFAREDLASALHLVFWGILGFAILVLIASLFLPGKELQTETAEQPQVEKV